MESEAFERPADLAVWPSGQAAGPGTSRHFPSLREAVAAAAGLLADPAREPWIVTEEGELLAPVRIRGLLARH